MSKTFKFLFVFILFYGLINKAYHEAWDYQLMDVKLIAGREYFRISDISLDGKHILIYPPGGLIDLEIRKVSQLDGAYAYFLNNNLVLMSNKNLKDRANSNYNENEYFIFDIKNDTYIKNHSLGYGENWEVDLDNILPGQVNVVPLGGGSDHLVFLENANGDVESVFLSIPFDQTGTFLLNSDKYTILSSNTTVVISCNEAHSCISPNRELYTNGHGVYKMKNNELIFSLDNEKLEFSPNANELFKPFKMPTERKYYGWNSDSSGIYALVGKRGIVKMEGLGGGHLIEFPYVFIEIPIPVP